MDYICWSDFMGNSVTETSFTNQSGTRLDTDEYPTRCVVDYDAETFGQVTHTATNNTTILRIYANNTTTSKGIYLRWKDISQVDYFQINYSTDGISWTTLSPNEVYGNTTSFGTSFYPTTTTDGQCLIFTSGSWAWKYLRVKFIDGSTYPSDTQISINWFIPVSKLDVHPPDATRTISLESHNLNTEQSFDGNLWTTSFGSKPRVLPELSWKDLTTTELTQFNFFRRDFKNNPHIILYTEELLTTPDWYVTSWNGEEIVYTEEAAGLYNATVSLREL